MFLKKQIANHAPREHSGPHRKERRSSSSFKLSPPFWPALSWFFSWLTGPVVFHLHCRPLPLLDQRLPLGLALGPLPKWNVDAMVGTQAIIETLEQPDWGRLVLDDCGLTFTRRTAYFQKSFLWEIKVHLVSAVIILGSCHSQLNLILIHHLEPKSENPFHIVSCFMFSLIVQDSLLEVLQWVPMTPERYANYKFQQ